MPGLFYAHCELKKKNPRHKKRSRQGPSFAGTAPLSEPLWKGVLFVVSEVTILNCNFSVKDTRHDNQ